MKRAVLKATACTMSLLRESCGLSQKELAKKMETSRSHINRLENSRKINTLRVDTVVKMARAFNVSPHCFMTLVEAVAEEVYGRT